MEEGRSIASFVLGPILGISRFYAAVLALSFFEGAYRKVILPQAISL